MSYSHLLVAYDGSNLSRKALQQAVKLAGTFGSKLSIVHVYQTPTLSSGDMLLTAPPSLVQEYADQAGKTVDSAKELVPQGIAASYRTAEGYPAQVLLDFADQTGVDLIVMGSRGLGAIREFVLGSVSHNVAQHAKVPVLIVK